MNLHSFIFRLPFVDTPEDFLHGEGMIYRRLLITLIAALLIWLAGWWWL